jgi:sodium-independent sulfate anion transporter 11
MRKSLKFLVPKIDIANYFQTLFPIITWLPRYNWTWFAGDLLAGISMGTLAIPQAMAYARLAGVPTEFGLYTAFTGTIVYAIFSTSKDVTIGMTAVLSILLGQLLQTYNTTGIDPVVWQCALSFLSGLIQFGLGFFKLGILVDLISVPVVIGFTTGAGCKIIFGQIASVFGISGIKTKDAPFLVLFNSLAGLPRARLDTAFGLSTIAALLAFRFVSNALVRKGNPNFVWLKHASYLIVLVASTLISFLLFRNQSRPPIRVVGNVPKGLTYVKPPTLSFLGSLLVPSISVVLVGVIEHIAMTKAFSRINGYRIDPNQEIIALGLTNVFGPFFGGYAATGSFSRSSVKSKTGVKSPFSGFITASVVLLSIYFLTPAFFFMPSASLAGVIVVSITDLIARPATIKELYDVDILDFLSFAVAALVTIFVNIEVGIFSSVGFSLLVLLFRIARPSIQVLVRDDSSGGWVNHTEVGREKKSSISATPFPGIVVFRINESMTYPNSNYIGQTIKEWVEDNTESGSTVPAHQLLWCEKPNNRTIDGDAFGQRSKSLLKAIVFDLSSVNHMDASGLQALVDVRVDVERWAGGPVQFYFAHVNPELTELIDYFLVKKGKQVGKVIQEQESSSSGTIEDAQQPLLNEHVFSSIDEAVAHAAAPFQFGSFSTDTIN